MAASAIDLEVKPTDRKDQTPEERLAAIRSARGKFRHLLTPSDEFARRKHAEIVLEDRTR